MGCPQNSGFTRRASIHLSLPETFDYGLAEAAARVRIHPELDAVEIELRPPAIISGSAWRRPRQSTWR
jgi:hypothetical protein